MIEHTIDATNQKLGRLATNIAIILRGKDTTEFATNKIPDVQINVINSDKMDIPEKKREEMLYTHYTGYPSGLRHQKLKKVMDEKGMEHVIRETVKGMLPANRLRKPMLKNLNIT